MGKDIYEVLTIGNHEFNYQSTDTVETSSGWKLVKDLKPGDYLIFDNSYVFPTTYVENNGIIVDENLAWLMGILVSEGSINNRYNLTVMMTDKGCIDRIYAAWKKMDININPLVYYRKAYRDKRGWNCKEAWSIQVCNVKLREKLVDLGLYRSVAINKRIPWAILQSPKSAVLAFIAGMWEGDGCFSYYKYKDNNTKLRAVYYTASENLCVNLQLLLKKLNIFSIRSVRKSNLSYKDQWTLSVNGQHATDLGKLLNVEKFNKLVERAYVPKVCTYKWVYFNKKLNKWRARTTFCDKEVHLGYFLTKEEASEAIEKYQKSLSKYIKIKSVKRILEEGCLVGEGEPNGKV